MTTPPPAHPHARFTDRSRKAVIHAAEAAARCFHGYVGTGHLLLALLRDGLRDGGVAGRVLADLGLDPADLGRRLRLADAAPPCPDPARPPRGDRLERALCHAAAVADARGDSYVGTEHLLLAMLDDPACFACRALSACGLRPQRVREAVAAVVPVPWVVADAGRTAAEYVGMLLVATAGLRRLAGDDSSLSGHVERVARELPGLVALAGAAEPEPSAPPEGVAALADEATREAAAPAAGEPVVQARTPSEAMQAFLGGARRVQVPGLGELRRDGGDVLRLEEVLSHEAALLVAAEWRERPGAGAGE